MTTSTLREDGSLELREDGGTGLREDSAAVGTWIDELRIVKGSAVWTSNFTPPTLPYTLGGDIAAFTGIVADPPAGVTGSLAATEAADTASFTGTVRWSATLAATEAADVAAFTGSVRWNAALAATETSDVAAFNGTVAWNAVLAATEAADTANFTGTVATPGTTTGSINAAEGPDTASFTGTVTGVAGTLAATEAADTAAFTGQALSVVTGTLSAIEAPDTASFIGNNGVAEVLPPGGGGAGWIDYGRLRRRKTRGLRQAEKFFEMVKADAEEKKRQLEVIATKATKATEKEVPDKNVGTSQAEALAQQQRQQQVIDAMLAQAAARVAQARQELAQIEAMQRAMDDMDEEDALTVLLLQ